MNKEELKLKLVKVFVETQPYKVNIDQKYIDQCINDALSKIIQDCHDAIKQDITNIKVYYYSLPKWYQLPNEERYRVWGKIKPILEDKLTKLGISFTIKNDELVISLADLAAFCNVKSLGALQ